MLLRSEQAQFGERHHSDIADHAGALAVPQTYAQPTMPRWTVVSVRSEQRRPIKSPTRLACRRPFEASVSLLSEPTHRAQKALLRQHPHQASPHKLCSMSSSSPSALPAPRLSAPSASAARRPCPGACSPTTSIQAHARSERPLAASISVVVASWSRSRLLRGERSTVGSSPDVPGKA